MNLIPWRSKKPSETEGSSIERFRSDMDRMMDRLFHDPWAALETPLRVFANWPALDVNETDDAVTVNVEVPGIDAKDLDIHVAGNLLTITGEKKEQHEEKNRNCYRSECRYGSFRRQVQLPGSVDPDQVTAEYRNGILTIELAKSQQTRPKHIELKTE